MLARLLLPDTQILRPRTGGSAYVSAGHCHLKDLISQEELSFAVCFAASLACTVFTWHMFTPVSRLPCVIVRYILRLLAALGTLLIITEQYMEPTIANSIVPLRELNVAHILERMLKLSLPTLYGWIIIFYALFHVWLNILAEVTYFGDREFYKVCDSPYRDGKPRRAIQCGRRTSDWDRLHDMTDPRSCVTMHTIEDLQAVGAFIKVLQFVCGCRNVS